MKNFCGIVGVNLRAHLYSGQPQGIAPTNASKIFIPASGVAKFFDSSFFIYNFSFYITMEQLISGVFGATVPEREISQFSNPLAALRSFGFSKAVSNLSKTGRGYSLYLSFQRLLTYLPASGYRNYTTGDVAGQGTNGDYWSSSASVSSTSPATYLYFNSASPAVRTDVRAYGFPVRCVQESTSCSGLYDNVN